MTQLLYLILACLISACNQESPNQVIAGYDMQNPVQVIALSAELGEISGLTFSDGHFLAIQDERGRVYRIEQSSGKLIEDRKFWDRGDFEGIELTSSYCYALKSNGNLYKFDPSKPAERTTEKISLDFPKNSNFEGLGFDPKSQQLLIAAKRQPSSVTKEIYAVSLDQESGPVEPAIVLDQRELLGMLSGHSKRGWKRLSQNLATANYSFNPSGIAVHPRSGDRFVLSSPVPQLLVISDKWKIKKVIFLNRMIFKQPEGICFDDAGNLYIANEGRGGQSNILKFVRQ